MLYNNEIPSSKMKIFEEKYSSVTNFININSINDLLNNENIDNEETIQTFTEISPSPIDIYKKKIYLFLKKNTFFIKILIILNIIIFLLWIFILFIGKYLDLFNLEEQPEEEIFKIIPQNIDETHTEQPKIEYEEKPDEFQWIFVN